MSLGNLIARGVMLGTGLAMDAFSVSLVNGMRNPGMKRGRQGRIAATFALFQLAMPMIGWVLVQTVIQAFHALEPLIPWVAFGLLGWIGGKMILEGLRKREEERAEEEEGMGSLLAQGLATSIDALSAGLAMAELSFGPALLEAGIIGLVTFGICWAGGQIGRKAGDLLADRASVFGGVLLVGIGVEILISHFL